MRHHATPSVLGGVTALRPVTTIAFGRPVQATEQHNPDTCLKLMGPGCVWGWVHPSSDSVDRLQQVSEQPMEIMPVAALCTVPQMGCRLHAAALLCAMPHKLAVWPALHTHD